MLRSISVPGDLVGGIFPRPGSIESMSQPKFAAEWFWRK